jgi:hypothetical protein
MPVPISVFATVLFLSALLLAQRLLDLFLLLLDKKLLHGVLIVVVFDEKL